MIEEKETNLFFENERWVTEAKHKAWLRERRLIQIFASAGTNKEEADCYNE